MLCPMTDLSLCGKMSRSTRDRKKRLQPLHTPRLSGHEGLALVAAQLTADYAIPSKSRSVDTRSHTRLSRMACEYLPPLLMFMLLLSPPEDISERKAKKWPSLSPFLLPRPLCSHWNPFSLLFSKFGRTFEYISRSYVCVSSSSCYRCRPCCSSRRPTCNTRI